MKLINLIVLVVLFVGCSLQSRLDKYCPLCQQLGSCSDSTSIGRDTIEKHDTVWKQSPADSALLKALANCQNGKANMPDTQITSGKATVKVGITNNVVNASAYCAADSFMWLYVEKSIAYREYRNRVKNTVTVVQKKPHPFFYWWFGITAACMLLYAIARIVKFFIAKR